MNIQEFISNYHNHPVLFVGTGLSLRYLKNSYSWDSLLQKVAMDFNENPEYYLDIKSEHMDSTGCYSFQNTISFNLNIGVCGNHFAAAFFTLRYKHRLTSFPVGIAIFYLCLR